jgi:hypothetical protein
MVHQHVASRFHTHMSATESDQAEMKTLPNQHNV